MCESYRYQVRKMFDNCSGALISNNMSAHAAILLENIFSHAQAYVHLVCGELSTPVYAAPGVRKAFIEALQRGVDVKIILCKGACQDPRMDAILKRYNVPVYNIQDAVASSGAKIAHFAVSDNVAYRFENDAERRSACGCAHAPDVAEKLEGAFAALLKFAVSHCHAT